MRLLSGTPSGHNNCIETAVTVPWAFRGVDRLQVRVNRRARALRPTLLMCLVFMRIIGFVELIACKLWLLTSCSAATIKDTNFLKIRPFLSRAVFLVSFWLFLRA